MVGIVVAAGQYVQWQWLHGTIEVGIKKHSAISGLKDAIEQGKVFRNDRWIIMAAIIVNAKPQLILPVAQPPVADVSTPVVAGQRIMAHNAQEQQEKET
jgi:hypothetical protein